MPFGSVAEESRIGNERTMLAMDDARCLPWMVSEAFLKEFILTRRLLRSRQLGRLRPSDGAALYYFSRQPFCATRAMHIGIEGNVTSYMRG
jgi:hypothetical protein